MTNLFACIIAPTCRPFHIIETYYPVLERGRAVESWYHKILIVGAGTAGCMVLEAKKARQECQLIGFIDDDQSKIGSIISGLPVLGNRTDIPRIVIKNRINEVIIAMPSAPPEEKAQIILICTRARVQVKILSGTYELNTGKIKPLPIRDVQLEDLLGRELLTLDTGEIKRFIKNQVVLITGAGGSVGTELSKNVADCEPRKLILVGRGENSIYEVEQQLLNSHPLVNVVGEIADIKDSGRISRVFERHKPGVVFHAAAHKHVPYMERIPEEAIKNNIVGTKVLCDVAYQNGCQKLILISTDKAVMPSSIMGATKKVAELIIQMMNRYGGTKFAAVRFGNILGSRGSVLPLFERQISMGGPVTITDPRMMRYFMTVSEAAQLVLQAGAMANGGEIFMLDMGKQICIKDLAYKLIMLKGLEPEKDIKIKYTGVRPGEKLSEVLFGVEETVKPTGHKKICAVYNTAQYNLKELSNLLATLSNKSFLYSNQDIKKLLDDFLLTK